MIVLWCVATIGVSFFLLWTTARAVRRRRWQPVWLSIFAISAGTGVAFAIYSIFQVGSSQGWQISSTMRFVGFPIPVVIFHNEGGDWIDFVHPTSIAWLIVISDIFADAALACLPIRFLAKGLQLRKRHSGS